MTKSTEQRESNPAPRYEARIAVYNGPDQDRLLTNYTVNMSTGGVFLETTNILPVHTLLAVKFKIPACDNIIACQARVAWTNEPGELRKFSLPPGMGLQFMDLSLKDLHAIREYLNTGKLLPAW